MKREIDCRELLDHCWAILNKAYEEAYGVKNYGYTKPRFRFILSHDEIMALRKYAANPATDAFTVSSRGGQWLFGHPIQEQRRTPYIQAILANEAPTVREK